MQNIVTLGEINDALKIAAVTAAQLADMGFAALANKPICEGLPPEESRRLRNAKLYPAESIGQIRVALAQRFAPPAAAADVPASGAAALSEYLENCEQHAIVPDVGGAFASAFTAGFSLAGSQAAQPAMTAALFAARGALQHLKEGGKPTESLLNEAIAAIDSVAISEPAPAAVAVPDAVRDAEKLLRTEAARLERIYNGYGNKWYGFSNEKAAHIEHLRVADALAATPPAAAPVVLPEPVSPVHIQALHLARRRLYAIAKTYDESELRTQALETDDEIARMLATATGLPAQAAKPSGLLTVDEYQAKYLHIHKMSDDERYGYESLYNEIVSGLQMPAAAPQAQAFQQRVQPWMMACFGPEISADSRERNHRFLEEALELVQSCGCTASEAHQLVDYVYGRPWGEPAQEVGGVMVTLAALCLANGLDMHACGETELARIWTKVEAIRAKQAAKPKHSPLPEHAPQAQADARDAEQEVLMEHSGCGSNTQVDMLTVRLNPGDKVVMHKGRITQGFDRANRAAIAAAKGE